MGLISDDTVKVAGENPYIIITAPCETMTCSICGKEYPSRGKNDIGICRECERYHRNDRTTG